MKSILLFLCSLLFIQSTFSQSVNAPAYTGSLNNAQVKFPMSFKGKNHHTTGAAMAAQFSGGGGAVDTVNTIATKYWVGTQIPPTLNLTPGTNITITGTYPDLNISATGGGSAPTGTAQRIAYFGADTELKDTANFYISGNDFRLPHFVFSKDGGLSTVSSPTGHFRITNAEIQFNNNANHGIKYGNFHLGTNSPHSSAKLHVVSTTQGAIICAMTTAQRLAISSPANGLIVFDTDLQTLCIKINGNATDGSTPSQGWAKIETTAAE